MNVFSQSIYSLKWQKDLHDLQVIAVTEWGMELQDCYKMMSNETDTCYANCSFSNVTYFYQVQMSGFFSVLCVNKLDLLS